MILPAPHPEQCRGKQQRRRGEPGTDWRISRSVIVRGAATARGMLGPSAKARMFFMDDSGDGPLRCEPTTASEPANFCSPIGMTQGSTSAPARFGQIDHGFEQYGSILRQIQMRNVAALRTGCPMTHYNLALLGFGGVNRALAQLVGERNSTFAKELGFTLNIVAISDLYLGSVISANTAVSVGKGCAWSRRPETGPRAPPYPRSPAIELTG